MNSPKNYFWNTLDFKYWISILYLQSLHYRQWHRTPVKWSQDLHVMLYSVSWLVETVRTVVTWHVFCPLIGQLWRGTGVWVLPWCVIQLGLSGGPSDQGDHLELLCHDCTGHRGNTAAAPHWTRKDQKEFSCQGSILFSALVWFWNSWPNIIIII